MKLNQILNQSNYAFFYLNVDQFLDITVYPLKNFFPIYSSTNPNLEKLKQNNQRHFSLKNSKADSEIKNSGQLLKEESVKNFIKKTCQELKLKAVIIPFKASTKVEYICKENKWIYAAIPAKLNRLLENKINFNQICQQNNLPVIPYYVAKFNQENFEKYRQSFDTKLVIQSRFGWSGKSTYLADNWQEIKDKIVLDTPVKFSPLLKGFTLINNCCISQKKLIQSPPAIQFTGIPQLTQNLFTTVGRQWPSFAPTSTIEKIKTLTNSFSKILIDLDFKGFFGLDFLITENQVFLLECNPRLTASIDLYTQIEITNELNPLFLFHLVEFLPDINIESLNIEEENERFYNSNLIGYELNKKNLQNKTIKRYQKLSILTQEINPIKIDPQIIQEIDEK